MKYDVEWDVHVVNSARTVQSGDAILIIDLWNIASLLLVKEADLNFLLGNAPGAKCVSISTSVNAIDCPWTPYSPPSHLKSANCICAGPLGLVSWSKMTVGIDSARQARRFSQLPSDYRVVFV
jgi:hypothetical protein